MGVYKNNNGDLELISGATLYADSPIGTIQAYGGATAPSGWLLCQGQAVSRTTYADLFSVIGTAFGSGDGSTTFNLPDLREATTKGVGLTGKSNNHYDSDGVALGEFIDDRFQGHNHERMAKIGRHQYETYSADVANGLTIDVNANYNSDGTNGTPRTGATTEVKAVGVNYIIKAQQVALPIDLEQGVADSFNFQSGVTANQSMSAGGNASVSITLTNPMPDDEYTVDVKVSNAWNIATISNQTENGFTIMIQNTDKSASSPTTVSWQAFRIPH